MNARKEEERPAWSAGDYLRHAILNPQYSLFRVVGKYVLVGGIAVSVITGTVSGLLAGEADKSTVVERLLDRLGAAMSAENLVRALALLVLLFLMDVVRCMARLASDRDDEAHGQLVAKDLLIADQRLQARLDLVTRIPNQVALKDAQSAVIRQGRVLIMIDIVGFREFNKLHSSHVANAVLREFAQFMFLRSRRVEHVYHRPSGIESDTAVFRLHRKGDEFLVVLEGGETDALGFLSRLRDETEKADSAIARAGGQGVLFYAGVFAIDADLQPDECLQRVDEILAHARQRPELGRVKWSSATDCHLMKCETGESERDFEFRRQRYKTFQTDPYWSGTGNRP